MNDTYKCWFDGSIGKNPHGNIGYSGYIERNGVPHIELYSGDDAKFGYTVNVAEHMGLRTILKHFILKNLTDVKIDIFGDSQIAVNHILFSDSDIVGYCEEIANENRLLFKKFTNITIKWIPREQNQEADRLSKLGREPFKIEPLKPKLKSKKVSKSKVIKESIYSSEKHDKFTFGKYKGKTVEYVKTNDLSYINWLNENVNGWKNKLK